ncbi:hypothetical protein TraAM80_01271 [Trypanosoma rangeli]|uniref:Uncharacterized protein n=1 Tax=Trypanosoma rangeli TaxID=5698 RepID=A0A3R7LBA1_TRYRA|nr:uncharacterized protein TraAM80_01271 [Trypanosoma rangeli]RNF10887.1 hypothetical protein TraAM80_01271 [Trypanosoma rangeli]|eukprot:RNF10887.1 hypothetical protein TraAM80_01271 [Trypanosoma rangeli]
MGVDARRASPTVVVVLLGLFALVGTAEGHSFPVEPVAPLSLFNGESYAASTFLYWAQVVSSFVEMILDSAEPPVLLDKVNHLTRAKKKGTVAREIWAPRSAMVKHVPEVEPFAVAPMPMYYVPPPKGKLPLHTCWSGYLAVPFNTTFLCSGTPKTATQYNAMTDSEREKCTYNREVGEVCLCPIGTVWVKKQLGESWVCIPRLLLVSTRLEDKFLCQDPDGEALGLRSSHSPSDFCLHVQRDETLSLDLNVSFRWMENDEIASFQALKGTLLLFGNLQYDEIYITVWRGVFGFPDLLARSSKLFKFVVKPDPLNLHAFGVVEGHPLQEDGHFEHVVYPFRDMALLQEGRMHQTLSERHFINKIFSGKRNFTLQRVERNLGLLSSDYVTNDMMYMEIGFCGSALPLGGRHARVWITFEELPPVAETYTYDQPLSSPVIAGIVFACAVVMGVLVAVGWYCCHRRLEVDDRLVIDAQDEQSQRRKKMQ